MVLAASHSRAIAAVARLFYFHSETISGVGGLCFEGDDYKKGQLFEEKSAPQRKSWLRP